MLDIKDKEQLISSILDELKELEMLTQGMQDPRMLQELAVKKAQHLLSSYKQLKETVDIIAAVPEPKEDVVTANEPLSTKPVQEAVVEATATKRQDAVSQKAEYKQPKAEQPKVVVEEPQSTASNAIEKQKPKAEAPNDGDWQQIPKENASHTNNDRYKTNAKANPSTGIGSAQVKRVDSIFVKSLKSALKLNDRIRYSRELFGGSVELLNSTIEELDQKNNLGEALAYINAQFNWDKENEAVVEFLSLLERRF